MTRKSRPSASQPAQDGNPPRSGTETPPQDPEQGEQVLPVITGSAHLLTPLQRRFCEEYMTDFNGTRAYIRARESSEVHKGTIQTGSAATEAYRLLNDPEVRSEIKRLLDERAVATAITADRVLVRCWEAATADVRDLVEHRIGSCRHCWGLYHQFQYTDAEFGEAQDKHIREQASKKRKDDGHVTVEFHEKGGPGFDPSRPPNPECPECWGDGKGRTIIKDTRHLSSGAAMIYEGVKVTKDGIEVKIADRQPFLNLVAKYLGMFMENPGPVTADNPLHKLLQHIQQQGSTLPIAQRDPEATDVVPRLSQPAPGAASGGWKAVKTPAKGKA